MNILYISVLSSQSTLDEVLKQKPDSAYSPAAQKFNRLIAEGIAKNGEKITALSTFFAKTKGLIWHHNSETKNGVRYKYIPTPLWGPLRYFALLLFSFFYVFFWGLMGRKSKVVVCDALNVSVCLGASIAAKILNLKCVGIVTDIPGLRPGAGLDDLKNAAKNEKFNLKMLSLFSHYVFLTEEMHSVINPCNNKYLVIEGTVDSTYEIPDTVKKEKKKVVLYAGALREEYGLRLLIEGFIKADVCDSELWLFGDGSYVEGVLEYEKEYANVRYFGKKTNSVVLDAELKSCLLVNPRPTQEEYTQYSFPSKNMEYMLSGTPLLTTLLPGMPKEYYPFVYLFDKGENVDGYAQVIRDVLTKPAEELKEKGRLAREWVLDNKNNIKQTKRLLDFVLN